MRYTKLTLDDLIKEFRDPDIRTWKTFLLNEIGTVLMEESGQEAGKAEAFFRELLDGDNREYKLVALRHLLALEYMEEETYEKLKEFPKKPGNKEIYLEAGEPML
jgi:hypothetical protein